MAAILMQPIEMTYAQVRELSITGAVGLQAVLESQPCHFVRGSSSALVAHRSLKPYDSFEVSILKEATLVRRQNPRV